MKNRLKQILEQIDPDGAFFTEEAINQLSDVFEVKINEKINEAEQTLIEKHVKELDEQDKANAEALRNLVEEYDKDVSRKMNIIIEKLKSNHAEEVESLIEGINDDHARKINFVIEKIEETHENKMVELAEKLDSEHAEKLEETMQTVEKEFKDKISSMEVEYEGKLDKLVEYYENEHTDNMVVKVSGFLDKFVAQQQDSGLNVEDKLKLEALENIFESVRGQLGISGKPVYLKESSSENKIDELIRENEKLNSQLKKMEARQLLNEKTENMSLDQSEFVRKQFVNSSVEEINENINEVVKAYKLNKHKNLQKLSDEYVASGVKVNIPAEDIIEDDIVLNENINVDDSDDVSHFVDMVKKLANKR